MRKEPNITRVKEGWQVRFVFRGVEHSRYFADSKHGNRMEKSFRAAVAWKKKRKAQAPAITPVPEVPGGELEGASTVGEAKALLDTWLAGKKPKGFTVTIKKRGRIVGYLAARSAEPRFPKHCDIKFTVVPRPSYSTLDTDENRPHPREIFRDPESDG